MTTLCFPSAWIRRVQESFAALAERPWALFVLLFAVNCIAMPYAGITHDARLYSVQVLNRVESGAYDDDLFFRYGSQDQYTLFSQLAAPLVRAIGLAPAFFVLYLLSKALLIFGMMRLVLTLVPDRTAGVVALLFCMTTAIHYGGQNVLHVQEPFLTSRLPAIGLVLIGLDLLLRQRPKLALVALLAAAGIHPLMAFGGLLLWAGYMTWQWFGVRGFLAGLAAAAALAVGVLSCEPLGKRVFGEMDDTWRNSIRAASAFNFPSEWPREDWIFLAFQFVLAGIVVIRLRRHDPVRMRFAAVLLVVSLAGVVGAVLAEHLPYAILLQGQPYRALWILGFAHLGFAFWLLLDWLRQPSPLAQCAGCGLLGYYCWVNGLQIEMLFPLFVFPIAFIALRGLERRPRDPAWIARSVQMSLVVGALAWVGYKYMLLISRIDELRSRQPELLDLIAVLLGNVGPVACIVLIGAALAHFGVQRLATFAVSRYVVAAALGLQIGLFGLANSAYYRSHCTQYRGDLDRLRTVMEQRHPAGQPLPTVYCNLGCLDYVWLDLHAKSYFDWWQAGGFMFRRETAVEGQRRACLVAPFEFARFGKWEDELTEGEKAVIGRFFQTEFRTDTMSPADLARLCREPGLDYVLLEQGFDGLYAAQSGRLYLYRCREVRNALGIPHPATSAVAASR